MVRFDHEKLDVYQVAIRMVTSLYRATAKVTATHEDLVRQARRAASSVPLNVAEASGEFSRADKIRFFRIARRSATECAAAIDILQKLRAIDARDADALYEYLDRIVAMLTRLTRPARE